MLVRHGLPGSSEPTTAAALLGWAGRHPLARVAESWRAASMHAIALWHGKASLAAAVPHVTSCGSSGQTGLHFMAGAAALYPASAGVALHVTCQKLPFSAHLSALLSSHWP